MRALRRHSPCALTPPPLLLHDDSMMFMPMPLITPMRYCLPRQRYATLSCRQIYAICHYDAMLPVPLPLLMLMPPPMMLALPLRAADAAAITDADFIFSYCHYAMPPQRHTRQHYYAITPCFSPRALR